MSSLTEQLLNGSISPLSRFETRCEPVTLGLAAMGAASAGMNIYGQFQARDTYNSVEEYRRIEQENAIEENRRRATQDYLTNVRLEQEQQQQEYESVAQKSVDIQAQATRSVATGMASAAERGVAGRTVEMIAQDFDFMANEETGRLRENQRMADRQRSENIRGMGTEWQNRVTSIKPYVKTPAKQIDFFGPIFKAGVQTLGNVAVMPAGSLKGVGFGAQASGSPNPGTNPLMNFPSVGV